jgi:hypothetical protein
MSASKRAARTVRRTPKRGTARGGHDDLRRRLGYVIDHLGSNQTARLLRVSQSQPSRWRSGSESMSPESRRRVVDLDYVMARLLEIYPERVAHIWLESHNAHLGARPIDVLRERGAGPVVAAIDAEAQGAFA